jgi:sulfate transport system substrate-binding protein
MLIENPVAVTLTGDAPVAARAFVDYLYTADAQRVFGRHGYRPVVVEVLAEFDYAAPPRLFTIADLGGWAVARPRFFDPDCGLVTQLFAELGRGAA